MKGIFRNILILSCAGIFSTSVASPIHSVPKMRHLAFDEVAAEGAIDVRFRESDDKCQKAISALYKIEKYYNKGDMENICNPEANIHAKFLDSGFSCDNEDFNKHFIEPGMKQRKYICSKDTKGKYCNVDALYRNIGIDESKIEKEICNESAGNACKTEYADFIKSLKSAFEDTDNDIIHSRSGSNGYSSLFTMILYKADDAVISSAEKLCIENGKTDPEQKPKEPTSTLGESKDGKCGSKSGICPSGECCSKYGYCGRSSKHCSVEKGCQSEFGDCTGKPRTTKPSEPTTPKEPTSTLGETKDGKCGPKSGICKSGECCSKHGYCGRSSDHCSVEKGCQSEFGDCTGKPRTTEPSKPSEPTTPKEPTSTLGETKDGKCGPKNGRCPSGYCCSKHGWCGTSSQHCDADEGCQSELGKCN